MMFRDHVGILAGWFKEWNECEQTVALLSLLKLVTHIQARFLQLSLEHSLADYNDIHLLESEANSAAIVSQWQQESKERKWLAYSIESNAFIKKSHQVLSYALIHPATTLEDHSTLALWLSHLEAQLASGFRTRPEPTYHSSQGSNEWGSPAELDPGEAGPAWLDKPPKENGQMPFHPPSSVLPAINSIGSNTNAGLPCQIHPSPLKHSMLLIPTKPQAPGEWPSPEELRAWAAFTMPDHAPLSPQSSVASSGSEQMEEQGSSQNTFQEDGSGMKDVPSWRKSLCFHKYTALFSQMSYEEMMTLTEQHLESQNVTKDEERITSYLQFIENCLTHEAFTETQKKRLLSWKQQMLKLLHTFLHKATLEMQNHRQQKGWAFGSNSLPIAGSGRQNLWFANPGGNDSMPSQSCSSVRRTHSLPVHLSPRAILMFPPDCPVPGPDLEINPTLESLCLNMTEHALGDGTDKTSTI
ncbi:hypothetical protein J1605_014161 [Eschrichtius robustus]|uniref:SMAUG/ZCCHC2-like PHAT domain-containing protein n=1 Tax=Eschrichtius robustus TaxID=9764 RepID=A0AB34GEP5_ESCRO|nr:hypothetical protein J1605_014161 [Eschrichtius robustus]